MASTITVGCKATAASQEAVAWAGGEAQARGARLRIVACYTIPRSNDSVRLVACEVIESLLAAAQALAEHAAAAVRADHPGLLVQAETSAGPAALVLVDGAAADDLVVVGASERHGLAAHWPVSTVRSVARHSECPVVVVRGAASRGRPDRVVVAVGSTPAATAARRWATSEARLHGVVLHLVRAWSSASAVVGVAPAGWTDRRRGDAAQLLDEALAAARADGVDATAQLEEGDTTAVLLGAVRDGDLLVVGRHGAGPAAGRLGATVSDLLATSTVPVVVVGVPAEPEDAGDGDA